MISIIYVLILEYLRNYEYNKCINKTRGFYMFKLMAAEMTDKDVRVCMSLLFDGSIIVDIKRNIRENSLTVEFQLMNYEENRIYRVNLLPDCIEQLSDGVRIKQDGLYHYQQFMIAKRYSEYWKDNIFV